MERFLTARGTSPLVFVCLCFLRGWITLTRKPGTQTRPASGPLHPVTAACSLCAPSQSFLVLVDRCLLSGISFVNNYLLIVNKFLADMPFCYHFLVSSRLWLIDKDRVIFLLVRPYSIFMSKAWWLGLFICLSPDASQFSLLIPPSTSRRVTQVTLLGLFWKNREVSLRRPSFRYRKMLQRGCYKILTISMF